jgi:hypothetical protein
MTKLIEKIVPDTPEEFAYIGSSIGRLGTAMSGFLLFQDNLIWNFAALVLTWIGFEVNGYFKLYQSEHKKKEDK